MRAVTHNPISDLYPKALPRNRRFPGCRESLFSRVRGVGGASERVFLTVYPFRTVHPIPIYSLDIKPLRLISLWEGCRESRSGSRDTCPESLITKHSSIRRKCQYFVSWLRCLVPPSYSKPISHSKPYPDFTPRHRIQIFSLRLISGNLNILFPTYFKNLNRKSEHFFPVAGIQGEGGVAEGVCSCAVLYHLPWARHRVPHAGV